MFKRLITYTDYNGVVHKDSPFYFHLSEMDATRFMARYDMDIESHVDKIKGNLHLMFEFVDDVVLSSYGVKTSTGDFNKSPDVVSSFRYSAAYDVLFEELILKEGAAQEFVKGLGLSAEAINQVSQNEDNRPALALVPDIKPKPPRPSTEDLLEMLRNDPILLNKIADDVANKSAD